MIKPKYPVCFVACWFVLCFFFPEKILAISYPEVIIIDSTASEFNISNRTEWTVDDTNSWLTTDLEACTHLEGYRPYDRNAFVYKQFAGPPIIRFRLQSRSSGEFVLHLRNTEINRVQLLITDETGYIWKSKMIGDTYPFNERYIQDRILAIPFHLEANRTYMCYLGMEKKNRMISSIIEISERKHWEARASQLNVQYGLSLGIFLAFMLVSFSLFFIFREVTYLYYGLYILSVFLILFSIHGFSFQFLYPRHPDVSQYFMLMAQQLAFIFANLYAFRFIGFRHHLRILRPLKVILIGLYVLGIINTILHLHLNVLLEKFLNLLFVYTVIFNIFFLFFFSLYYYLRFRVIESLVYFLSFSAVGLAVLYTYVSFFVPALIYVPAGQSLVVGLTVEMLILTVFMILKYKNTENKRLLAERQVTEEKIRNQYALITGQELEKRKIALYLHDHIGSSIVLLKQKLENLSLENIASHIKTIRSEVLGISREIRDVSHELLPVTLEEIGLVAATRELIKRNETIAFHFTELTPTHAFTKNEAVQLYRILQELIKNSYQHARASHVSVQFFTEPDNFQLTYEDDGIGLDKNSFKKGLGFKSLETRVSMLKGSYTLESEPGRGVLILIDIPLENHGFGDNI